MRTLFILILLIAGSLAAAWLGGETWLAREAARRIEADPRIESAAVTPPVSYTHLTLPTICSG